MFSLQEEDKSSDIEQQPPYGDCKYSNKLQNRGIQIKDEFKAIYSLWIFVIHMFSLQEEDMPYMMGLGLKN